MQEDINLQRLYLPKKSLFLPLSMPMSNPVEVSQDAADHVQEVNAAHAPFLPPLSSLLWEDR